MCVILYVGEQVLVAKTKNNMGEALRIEGKYDEALQVSRLLRSPDDDCVRNALCIDSSKLRWGGAGLFSNSTLARYVELAQYEAMLFVRRLRASNVNSQHARALTHTHTCTRARTLHKRMG